MPPRQQLDDGLGRSPRSRSGRSESGSSRASTRPARRRPPSARTRQARAASALTGGPQRDRAAQPAAEAAYGVGLGVRERVAGVDRHASSVRRRGHRRAPTRCRRRRCRARPCRPGRRPAPRIDCDDPEPALGRGGLGEPAGRDAGALVADGHGRPRPRTSSSSTHAGASGADVGRRRCRGRRAPRRPARPRPVGRQPHRLARRRHRDRQRPARVSRSSADGEVGRRRSSALPASCCRISDRSATSCSPASRPSSANPVAARARRRAAAPAPAPGARRRGRPGPAGRAPRCDGRRPLRRVALAPPSAAATRDRKPTIGPPISSRKTLP